MAASPTNPNNPPATIKKTGQFMRQGQTAGPYGNDPLYTAKGDAGAPAQDLTP